MCCADVFVIVSPSFSSSNLLCNSYTQGLGQEIKGQHEGVCAKDNKDLCIRYATWAFVAVDDRISRLLRPRLYTWMALPSQSAFCSVLAFKHFRRVFDLGRGYECVFPPQYISKCSLWTVRASYFLRNDNLSY